MEKIDLVLLYCFQSPKKEWTQLVFGQSVEGDNECGLKPLDFWYPTKNIKKSLPKEMYGSTVECTLEYKPSINDLSRVNTVITQIEWGNDTYNLV